MNKRLKQILSYNTIFLVIIVAILNISYCRFVYSTLISLTKMYVSNTIKVATIAVQNNINEKISEVKLVSQLAQISNESLRFQDKLNFLTNFKEKNNTMRFYISNLNGRSISNYGEVTYIQEYDFFKNALKGISSMSEPVYSYYEGKWVVSVATPIYNHHSGTVDSIFIADYDIQELSNLIEGISLGDETINFIISKDGAVVVSNSDILNNSISRTGFISSDADEEEFATLLELQYKAAEKKEGNGEYTFYGVKKYAMFEPIQNNDWVLISSVPVSILYEKIYILSYQIVIFTLVIFVVVMFMTFYSKKLNMNLEYEKFKSDIVIKTSNMFIVKIKKDGKIIDCNYNFIDTTGYIKENIKDTSIYEVISENYIEIFKNYISSIINKNTVLETTIPIITNNGNLIYVIWNYNIDSYLKKEIHEIELIGTDITKIKEFEFKVQKLAYFDQLTGLHNLIYLEEYFDYITKSENKSHQMALIYLDFDNFKYINDLFGHTVGDKFIIDICKKIKEISNDKASICRNGGDEIIILYENIEDDEELNIYMYKVFNSIKEDYYINSIKFSISSSIGVSVYPKDGNTYCELFKSADIAMNFAKEKGKNRIQLFNNEMKKNIYEVVTIENEMRTAIENNEFILYYQPQYKIDTGLLYGFEALIRWKNPRKGLISPIQFIPQAEKNQLIIPIGDWVLGEAADFINEIKKQGFDDICVSVNVSVVQMMCENYVEKVLNILEEKHINPKNIKLEITESVMMESIEDMLQKINTLNLNGIYFSLDDFGTGYSSLTYLKKIPIKILKIDKSFVDTIMDKNGNKEILSYIIDLAHNINLEVVAEGIEEDTQLEWLRNKGCNVAQGFYMGKPMPKEEAIKELGHNMYKSIDMEVIQCKEQKNLIGKR